MFQLPVYEYASAAHDCVFVPVSVHSGFQWAMCRRRLDNVLCMVEFLGSSVPHSCASESYHFSLWMLTAYFAATSVVPRPLPGSVVCTDAMCIYMCVLCVCVCVCACACMCAGDVISMISSVGCIVLKYKPEELEACLCTPLLVILLLSQGYYQSW